MKNANMLIISGVIALVLAFAVYRYYTWHTTPLPHSPDLKKLEKPQQQQQYVTSLAQNDSLVSQAWARQVATPVRPSQPLQLSSGNEERDVRAFDPNTSVGVRSPDAPVVDVHAATDLEQCFRDVIHYSSKMPGARDNMVSYAPAQMDNDFYRAQTY